MSPRILCISILTAMSIFAAEAQSPMPIIVPAMSPANAAVGSEPDKRKPQSAVQEPESFQAAIKMLQEAKAANDEMLKRQEATLQQLDELQKAADQLKIFSKRG